MTAAANVRLQPNEPDRRGVERTTMPGCLAGPLFFAQVREDPVLEIKALHPGARDTVIVVSSGGCSALSLLAAGAGRVVAVDSNATQNHLVELKLAAICHLEWRDALDFIGAGQSTPEFREAAYAVLRPHLSYAAQAYWDRNRKLVRRGLLAAGVSERFIGAVVAVMRALVHPPARIARLLACESLEEQRKFFAREWDTRRWRALFALLLNRRVFRKALDPSFFRHTGSHSFAAHFRALAEHTLTEIPVASNYFLHQMLTGAYPVDITDGVPPYLSEDGAQSIAARRDAFSMVDGTYTEYLRRCRDRSISCFALSNICEWLSEIQIDALFEQIARVAMLGARVVFRNFVGWTEVPDRWRSRIVEDRTLGERLIRRDRSVVQRRIAVCRVT